jgi:hypothetical protein
MVGFAAVLGSGFLIGTGAFDYTTTCFTVDWNKVYCRPAYVAGTANWASPAWLQ